MGDEQDEIIWVVQMTSQMRHRADGDILLPQSSRRWLTKDCLIRARRVLYVPPGIFGDTSRTAYRGDVEDDILEAVHREMARMF